MVIVIDEEVAIHPAVELKVKTTVPDDVSVAEGV